MRGTAGARWRAGALAAMTAIGCAPGNAGTDSESGTSEATGTTAGTSEEPTGTTGGAIECGPHGDVVADVTVTWGIPLEPCGEESCAQEREAMCTVSGIAGGEWTLECDHPGLGMATDVVRVNLVPDGGSDLEVGAAVSLVYASSSFFEGGGSRMLRITDAAGLVLGAVSGVRTGGFSGSPKWGTEVLGPAVSPLSGMVANASCTDDEDRNMVTVRDGTASVTVHSGSSGVLMGSAAWQVAVERASRVPTPDYDEEELDVAVMRIAL